MSGKNLWSPQAVTLNGKVGSPMTCSFEYHGEGNIRRVIRGCACIGYNVDGNKVNLTFKKSRPGIFSQLISVEVVDGQSTMHILKVRLDVA